MKFDEFTQIFWSDGNVKYSPNDENFKKYIVPWVDKLRDEQLPVVLPRYDDKIWYFYAFYEKRKESVMKEYLRDFLGVYDLINITDPRTTPDLIDKTCLKFSNNKCLKFKGNKHNFEQLIRLNQVLTNKPSIESSLLNRPIGQLISRFRQAVFQRDKKDILTVLNEIQKTNNFSWQNILYLKVQMHASLGEWYQIYSLPDLYDLVRIKVRPKYVTQSIIAAIYNIKLASYVEKCDYDGLINAFSEKVFPDFRDLFAYRGKLDGIETIQTFLLKQICNGKPSVDEVTELEDIYPDDSCVVELAKRCRALISPNEVGKKRELTLFEQANACNEEWKYDDAYRLFKQCDLSDVNVFFKMAEIIVPSPNTAYKELVFLKECYDNLSITAQEQLSLNSRAAILVECLCKKVQEQKEISSWTDWACKLCKETKDLNKYSKIAHTHSNDWDLSMYDNNANLKEFETLLEELLYDDLRRPVLREVAGDLVCSFVGEVSYSSTFTCMYKIIFETLICDDCNDSNTIFEVFGYILDSGLCAQEEYIEIVSELINVWELVKSPKTITLGLDALDALLMYPDPSKKELSLRLYNSVLSEFKKPTSRRISQGSWDYFGQLCSDIGLSEQFSEIWQQPSEETLSKQESINKYLCNKTIAIYTLIDNVSRKVKEVLKIKYPETDIKLSNASGNTPELENMARTSDIFIFATGAAKHAAFYAVKNNRSEGLLYPKGKGASSMIACLEEYFDRLIEENII